MLSQTLVSIPLQLRKNFTTSIYSAAQFKELEHLFSEYTVAREAEALTQPFVEPHDVLLCRYRRSMANFKQSSISIANGPSMIAPMELARSS